MKTLLERFMNKVRSDWQWTGCKAGGGYGQIKIGSEMVYAHRVSYELFNGPIPQNAHVLHDCDDRGCVNPEHLHLGDRLMNMREMRTRGRDNYVSGESHGRAKLCDDQVIEIRKSFDDGVSATELSKKYGVDVVQIRRIINRANWKHI